MYTSSIAAVIISPSDISSSIIESFSTFLNFLLPIFSFIIAFDNTPPAIAAIRKPVNSGIRCIMNIPIIAYAFVIFSVIFCMNVACFY